MNKPVKSIVIVGGGTAGWMAAAALSERYKQQPLAISLVESDQIGTVGVGEATVPGIIRLHQHLGISEREFIHATGATFKLGIEFQDWYQKDHRFFHPFAAFGVSIAGQDFYQCWLKLFKEGLRYNLEDFCLAAGLAKRNRFALPDNEATTPLAFYSYAYHFDASRYALFLRDYACQRGVRRIEGKVNEVKLAEDGSIRNISLENGVDVAGDLFVDCTGFRALLIEQTMKTDFEDWSHWLPCDSAIAVQSQSDLAPTPYTRSTALDAGWQWRIPLSHRIGNGYVYCSKFINDDSARHALMANIEGEATTEPRLIKFTTGMRRRFWNRNCVALGLASGFLEPLESTSISLIQTGVEKLMQFMPDLVIKQQNIEEANRLNRLEYERIRDFIILHYKASQRRDSEFWQSVGDMQIPLSLREKIDAFEKDGSVLLGEQESFAEQSWIAMYNGFNRIPQMCKANARLLDSEKLKKSLEKMREVIAKGIEYAPKHEEFLKSVYE